MENTTYKQITQFVNDNVEGLPLFKGFVVAELTILMHQNPTLSMGELLQDATEMALEEWDREVNQD